MKSLLRFTCLLALVAAYQITSKAQFVINEIQVANYGVYADDDGDLSDWIEIYNNTGSSANFKGWYVSDDPTNLKKWRYPNSYSVGSKGLVLMFCSGKNRVSNGSIHTNFKLDFFGSDIYLSDSTGKLIDHHQASGINSRHSWSRIPDGSGWCIAAAPTPKKSNNNSTCYTDYCKPPVYNLAPGFYKSSRNLSITSPDGGIIRYTIDGSTPTAGSTLYKGPIKLDSNRVVKARCFKSGLLPSDQMVTTYFIGDSTRLNVVSFSMAPSAMWGADSGIYYNYSSNAEREGYIEMLDVKGKPLAKFGANLSINGGASRSYAFKSIKAECRPWLDSPLVRFQVHPYRKVYTNQSLNFRNAGVDWLDRHCTDGLVQTLARGTNTEYNDWSPVIAYMNGRYYGLMEVRVKQDNDYLADLSGCSPDSVDELRYWGDVMYGSDSGWTNIQSFINSNDMTDSANWAQAMQWADLANITDYIAFETYIYNTDWPGNNIKWWRKQNGGKWRFILWDTDFGFGFTWGSGTNTNYSVDGVNYFFNSGSSAATVLKGLTKYKEGKYYFVNRYADLINTKFRSDSCKAFAQAIFDTLKPEIFRPFKIYRGASNTNYWDNATDGILDWIDGHVPYGRQSLKNYFSTGDTVQITIDAYPAGSGKIKISTIYPRKLPWTGTYFDDVPVTITAIPNPGYTFSYWKANSILSSDTYTQSITVDCNNDETFTAVFTGSAEPFKLSVSEINYNSNKSLNTGNWIELHNYGNADIDLTACRIEDRTPYHMYTFPMGTTIPAGGYMLLTDDTSLVSPYAPGNVQKINMGFGFKNSWDRLTIFSPWEEIIADVKFEDKQPWPLAADGHGRTMELVNDTCNPSLPSSWFNGCIGGSPGRAYSACNEPLIISEINYNSASFADAGDWFELHNTTGNSIDVGKWIIRNNNPIAPKVTIPSGTTIAAGEWLAFSADTAKFFSQYGANKPVVYLKNLVLNNNGDAIELYNANDSIKFSVVYDNKWSWTSKADGQGYTLELADTAHDFSDGRSWFAGCLTGSPDTAYADCGGSIVISEINYSSALYQNTGDWIELFNSGDKPIDVSGWQVSDANFANRYTIPSGTTIDTGAYLVVCADTALFHAYNPWVTNYIGNLGFGYSSKGDNIKVYNSRNQLVTALKYNDTLPWPVFAGGYGYTLEIKDPKAFLSDGTNWFRGCLGGSPGTKYSPCYNDSLVFSEINYNSSNKADVGDWVELWNMSSKDVNIGNWIFQDGAPKDTMIVPAGTVIKSGERIVFANDTAKFNQFFTKIKVSGVFDFGLASSAEAVRLVDPNGIIRTGTQFASDSLWPQGPNGNGFTLELMSYGIDISNPSRYTEGCPMGTPTKAPGNCYVDVAFSEINYYSDAAINAGDWVEIRNNSKIPVNLEGFKFVNQDGSGVFSIPEQPKLLFEGEYAVIVNDSVSFKKQFPGISFIGNFPFNLKNTGEQIYLTDSVGNVFTTATFAANFKWPQGANGLGKTLERSSFNTDPSKPEAWFDGCIKGSPGAGFTACPQGIVISEINYGPANFFNTGVWVEIGNRSTDTINLAGYQLKNQSANNSFTIPNGIKLNPNEYIVVTNDSARFRTYFKNPRLIGNTSFIFNKQDRIRLYDAQSRPVFIADYDYQSPWPTSPDATGYTLEYSDTATSSSGYKNWFAGCFGGSPGTAYQPCNTDLHITELNYRSDAGSNSGDWIEIYNNGTTLANPKGWRIKTASGQNVVIPSSMLLQPGDYGIVSADSAKFDQIYYNIKRIGKGPALNDNGDTLWLYDMNNNLVETFFYGNSSLGWPKDADGLGKTLEKTSPASDPTQLSSWSTFCIGGSPGMAPQNCTEPLVVSEINYASNTSMDAGDWLEIFNRSGSTKDISGYSLTVGSVKFTLPNGIVLNAGDRYLIVADQAKFNGVYAGNSWPKTALNINLQTNSLIRIGDKTDKVVFAMEYAQTNWPDANANYFTLESSLPAQGFSEGSNWFAGCPLGSPGTAYAPCTPSLVINEINYHSDDIMNTGDWFELYNAGNTPAVINGLKVTNADGTQTFTASSNQLLLKGQYLVLVEDTTLFDVFNNVSRIGNTGIDFDGSGDAIKVYGPSGNLITSATIQSLTGWPVEADGFGRTMELVSPGLDQNDAASWTSGCLGGSPGKKMGLCNYDVLVSEVNFASRSDYNTGDWVELEHNATSAIDMSGWKIRSNSGTATIPQGTSLSIGQFVVIAKSAATFNALVPSVAAIDNGVDLGTNDVIRVYDANNRLVFVLTYASDASWPTLPNGNGNTLERNGFASVIYSTPSLWMAGCFGGSPGKAFAQPCSLTGITTTSSQDGILEAYPNPANQTINLRWNGSQRFESEIRVYNMQGALINLYQPNGGHQYSISLDGYAPGMYFVQVKTGETLQQLKFIKE